MKNNLNTRKRFTKLGQILKKQIVKSAHGKIGAKNSAGKHKKIINKNTARNFKPGSLWKSSITFFLLNWFKI